MTAVSFKLSAFRLLGGQSKTADQQSDAASDRVLSRKIRQALIADKSLSTYGHNVKIGLLAGIGALATPGVGPLIASL